MERTKEGWGRGQVRGPDLVDNAGEGRMEKTQGTPSFFLFLEKCFSFLKTQTRGSHSRLFRKVLRHHVFPNLFEVAFLSFLGECIDPYCPMW